MGYWIDSLFELETDMAHCPTLKEIWNSFWFPGMQWCREVMVALWEVRYGCVPDRTKRKIEIYENSMKTTLLNENGGRMLRNRESAVVTKKMAHIEKYHTLVRSPLLEEFHRNPIKPTAAAEACKPKKLSDDLFTAKSWKHSLGADFDRLGCQANWPTIVHETRMECFLSFASYLAVNAEWQRHFSLWHSTFAVTNHIIFEAGKPLTSGILCFHYYRVKTFTRHLLCFHHSFFC